MSKRRLSILVAVALIFGVSFARPQDSATVVEQTREPSYKTPSVSMIKLIANGNLYDGEYIRAFGYFKYDRREDHETQALFLSIDDSKNTTNGIWLQFDLKKVNRDRFANKWVFVQGVFRNNEHGWYDLYEAEIDDVDRVVLIR